MSATKSEDKQESRQFSGTIEGRSGHLKGGARAQILAAAAELAKESGAAHISIDAIARRAGISKGGLLYHFPKKDALIQALVEQHLTSIEAMIEDAQDGGASKGKNAVARAYIRIFRDHFCVQKKKPDGILIALAENPHLLDPVRAHQKRMVERVRRSAADQPMSLIALLVAEGIKALDLFEANPLTTEERAAVLDRLLQLLDEPTDSGDRLRIA